MNEMAGPRRRNVDFSDSDGLVDKQYVTERFLSCERGLKQPDSACGCKIRTQKEVMLT